MRFLIHFLILVNTLSCTQDKKVKLEKDDFSISYPSDWNLDDSGKEGTYFILTADKDGENDVFVENINLSTQNVGNITFNEFAKKMEKEVSSVAKIVERKKIKVNGKDCLSLKMTATQNNIDVTFVQHYYIENQRAYVLTFSSETKEFNNYFDEMNEVLLSFKLN